jgi:hypothetical protein
MHNIIQVGVITNWNYDYFKAKNIWKEHGIPLVCCHSFVASIGKIRILYIATEYGNRLYYLRLYPHL